MTTPGTSSILAGADRAGPVHVRFDGPPQTPSYRGCRRSGGANEPQGS